MSTRSSQRANQGGMASAVPTVTLGRLGRSITALATVATGDLAAAVSEDGNASVWRIPGFAQHAAVTVPLRGRLGLAIGSNGAILAVWLDRTVAVYDLLSGQPCAQFDIDAPLIDSVAVSPIAPILATAGSDETVRLWRATDGHPIAKLRAHSKRATWVAFSPDGATLASAGMDGTIHLWDGVNGDHILALSALEASDAWPLLLYSARLSPDGGLIAAGVGLDLVSVWRISAPETVHRARTRTPTTALAFTPDSRHLAIGEADGFSVWDLEAGRLERRVNALGGLSLVDFTGDGSLLFSDGYSEGLRLFQTSDISLIGTIQTPHDTVVTNLAGRRQLITGEPDGTVRLRRLPQAR